MYNLNVGCGFMYVYGSTIRFQLWEKQNKTHDPHLGETSCIPFFLFKIKLDLGIWNWGIGALFSRVEDRCQRTKKETKMHKLDILSLVWFPKLTTNCCIALLKYIITWPLIESASNKIHSNVHPVHWSTFFFFAWLHLVLWTVFFILKIAFASPVIFCTLLPVAVLFIPPFALFP